MYSWSADAYTRPTDGWRRRRACARGQGGPESTISMITTSKGGRALSNSRKASAAVSATAIAYPRWWRARFISSRRDGSPSTASTQTPDIGAGRAPPRTRNHGVRGNGRGRQRPELSSCPRLCRYRGRGPPAGRWQAARIPFCLLRSKRQANPGLRSTSRLAPSNPSSTTRPRAEPNTSST